MLSAIRFYLQTRLVKDEEGQGMVEYGLILALVAVGAIVILGAMGGSLQEILTAVKEALAGAVPSAPAA